MSVPEGGGGHPAAERGERSASLYVHVPFCAHRCDYCDFATWTDRGHLVDEYLEACRTDVARRVAAAPGLVVDTVFVGGGTPSLVPAAGLARVLAEIPLAPGAEVTVECNPDSVAPEALAVLVDAGVNRVSLGVQSMVPAVLAALGRTHDPANVVRAVAAVRAAGIEHLNVDLIYGAEGESTDDWRATLASAVALGPDHVSAYALTVESGTPLGKAVAAGERRAPDDDDQATKYEMADDVLGAAGFEWYEISNWARPGGECRHNLVYWTGGDYLAVGCAAHGRTGARRWWNVRTPERYVAAIRAGADPAAGAEEPGPATRAFEAGSLALRTAAGVAPEGVDPEGLAAVRAAGLVESAGGRIRLTRPGRLLANEVTVRLFPGPGTDVAISSR